MKKKTSKYLKSLRKHYGDKILAKKIGVTERSIYNWGRGLFITKSHELLLSFVYEEMITEKSHNQWFKGK